MELCGQRTLHPKVKTNANIRTPLFFTEVSEPAARLPINAPMPAAASRKPSPFWSSFNVPTASAGIIQTYGTQKMTGRGQSSAVQRFDGCHDKPETIHQVQVESPCRGRFPLQIDK